jgi:hypothetical protein
MGQKLGWIAGLAAAVALTAGAGAVAAADPPLSPAQIALFESDHLKDIHRPVVLDYSFHHHGGADGDYDDKVSAKIREIHQDGSKDVWIDFLSGARRLDLPPAMGFKGNPLLVFFLEHDASEMRAATGGSVQYFRNRISEAFAVGTALHPVEVKEGGATLKAVEIDVAPFRHDPHLERFPALAGKTYHFILSDAVPGSLYEISTTLAASGDTTGAFEEKLTYAGEHEDAH